MEKKMGCCRNKVKATTLKFRNWSHSITYEQEKAYINVSAYPVAPLLL
jgi:hypothetical protein